MVTVPGRKRGGLFFRKVETFRADAAAAAGRDEG